jgi:hypothetical protein
MSSSKRRRLFIAIVLLASFALGLAIPSVPALARPLPQDPPPQDTAEDLAEFLTWLLTGAGALFLGAGIAFFAEHIPAFQRVSTDYKFPVIVAATIVLSVIIQIIVTIVPPDVFAAIQPYWRTAIVVLFALVSSQTIHKRFLT